MLRNAQKNAILSATFFSPHLVIFLILRIISAYENYSSYKKDICYEN